MSDSFGDTLRDNVAAHIVEIRKAEVERIKNLCIKASMSGHRFLYVGEAAAKKCNFESLYSFREYLLEQILSVVIEAETNNEGVEILSLRW